VLTPHTGYGTEEIYRIYYRAGRCCAHFASGTSAAVHAAQDGVPLGLCRIRAEMHVGTGKAPLAL